MDLEHRLTKEEKLKSETLPLRTESWASMFSQTSDPAALLKQSESFEEISQKIENFLLEKIRSGDKTAVFQLGQFHHEQGSYEKARAYFERIEDEDFQAMYQLGVMHYDGLGTPENHSKGVEYMRRIAEAESKRARQVVQVAQYQLGRAYMEGYGVQQSDAEAEKWWLLAAADGNPNASVKAQTALGMFYCRPDSLNLKKAFFWHSEATGNGSLESQAALGILYETGLGHQADADSAFECLREAADRGNVYAMGNLVMHYYRRKLFTKAAELAARLSQLENVELLSLETDCLPLFIAKGIAMGSFLYARCLQLGLGVRKHLEESGKYYSRAFHFDSETTQRLQNMVTHGKI